MKRDDLPGDGEAVCRTAFSSMFLSAVRSNASSPTTRSWSRDSGEGIAGDGNDWRALANYKGVRHNCRALFIAAAAWHAAADHLLSPNCPTQPLLSSSTLPSLNVPTFRKATIGNSPERGRVSEFPHQVRSL